MLTNKRNGTLYIGVTNDLRRRVHEHKEGLVEGFSRKHNTKILVYYEIHHDIRDAIIREKRMKAWKREYKTNLIEKVNPYWDDLTKEIMLL
ncbi:MAG: GIY-YIG nuclease family protein [Deltaproteobacteria bacterium]|nr:GIY-YIG nuclease family protein [Deltaproteobacteria bacterium]